MLYYLCPNTCRMDGVSLLGKIGTANRDLCHSGMSMLGCWSQTLQHFLCLATTNPKFRKIRIRLLSRGVIIQRIRTVSTGTATNCPRAAEQRLPSRWHRFNDFVAQVQTMPLCPDGVVAIKDRAPWI